MKLTGQGSLTLSFPTQFLTMLHRLTDLSGLSGTRLLLCRGGWSWNPFPLESAIACKVDVREAEIEEKLSFNRERR